MECIVLQQCGVAMVINGEVEVGSLGPQYSSTHCTGHGQAHYPQLIHCFFEPAEKPCTAECRVVLMADSMTVLWPTLPEKVPAVGED